MAHSIPKTFNDIVAKAVKTYPSLAPLMFLYGVGTFDAGLLMASRESEKQNNIITKLYLGMSDNARQNVSERYPALSSHLERAFLKKNLPAAKRKSHPKKM